MDPNIHAKALSHAMRRDAAISELIKTAKALEPQLRDLGANHTADRLAAILDQIDQIDKAMQADIANDPLKWIEYMADMERSRRR